MNSCPSHELLERFLESTLSAQERQEVESHIETCSHCWEELERLTASAGEHLPLPPLLPCDSTDEPDSVPESGVVQRPSIPGYQVLEEVGEGGMGIVYQARDLTLGRTVALKLLLSGEVASPRQVRRFHREAQVLAQLTHENIVPVYEARLLAGRPYFAMQFIRGGSLARQLPRFRDDPQAAAVLMEKVARAVDYAHEHGVLHRDLKPANILLDEEGKPWVSDFGLAKLLTAPDTSSDTSGSEEAAESHAAAGNRVVTADSVLTHLGAMPGTPAYMAPEQLDPEGGTISPATDVWALGVVLYELFTGQRPFAGQTREELFEQIRRGSPRSLRKEAPRLDGRLQRIVLRCLEKDPRRRYSGAAELAEALAALRSQPAPRWHTLLTLFCGTALLIAMVVTLGSRGERRVDPYQNYLRDTSSVLQRLEQGEAVDLVGPSQLPSHYVRAGEGATKVQLATSGLNFFSSALGLVELLPHVPLKRYRIIAELQHDHCDNPTIGLVGIYCKGAHARAGEMQYHLLHLLTLNDCVAPLREVAGKGKENVHIAWLKFVAIRLDDSPNLKKDELPYKYLFHDRSATRATTLYPPLPPNCPKPWRTIVLEVDEGKIVARVNIPSRNRGETTFAPLDTLGYQEFLDRLRNPLEKDWERPEFKHIENRQIEPKSLGVCVSCGRCIVRRFRIEPLPPGGR
jgi:serine/threonine protein kinase